MSSGFTREQLLHRACLRAAFCIRSMHHEKGGRSDTRFLNPPIIPDDLTIVGRSAKYAAPGRREHVVPRLVITERCHEMIEDGETDDQIAEFIAAHLKIVLLAVEESHGLDAKDGGNVRQRMPDGWVFGDDPFRRLNDAKIAWALDADAGLAVSPDHLS